MRSLTISERHSSKIVALSALVRIADRARRAGKSIVTTNGCFDVLHVGHVRSLAQAKALGDVLIVGINSDVSARQNKPKGRPIVPARERAEMIAAIDVVDYVIIFSELTPSTWLTRVRPHIHAKGSDRTLAQVVERDAVKKFGGTLVLLPHTGRHSTTNIIEKILRAPRTVVPKK
jgi:rfaE bifunctional protein nucleotidyltransferase chain/domain